MLFRIPMKVNATAKYRIKSGNLPTNRKKAIRDSFPVLGRRTNNAVTKTIAGNAVSSDAIIV
jgi:hypothetical protein